ncbi:16351_t:CDS:2, partial [Dentiscutata erythropus]
TLESNDTSDRSRAARLNDPPSENDHHEQEENPVQSSVLHSDRDHTNLVANKESNSAPITYNKLPQFKITTRPPFPPTIDPKDLVNDLFKRKSQPPKMLNEFFIYRKAFVQELKKQRLRVKMTLVSSQASIYWHQETSQVKEERMYMQEYKKRQQQISNLAVNSANTFNTSISSAISSTSATSASTAPASDSKDAKSTLEINPSTAMFNNTLVSTASVHHFSNDNYISYDPSFGAINFDYSLGISVDNILTPIVPSQRDLPDPTAPTTRETQEQ